MKVSFVIPVYNNLELTRQCLETLAATIETEGGHEIIVVDDGSDSATSEGLLSMATEQVRVLTLAHNGGYAHANNQGALIARGEFLFLLNNDLRLRPGWFEPMLRAFRDNPEAGIVGNVQLNASTGAIDHAGGFVSLDTKLNHRREANRKPFARPLYTRAHYVTGACCAIRRELFLSLGGFDESFVNGCEDADLCFRLDALGLRSIVANASVVEHHVSATRERSSDNNERNTRLLKRRWRAPIVRLAASRWPDHYMHSVAKHWFASHLAHFGAVVAQYFKRARDVAPRTFGCAESERQSETSSFSPK